MAAVGSDCHDGAVSIDYGISDIEVKFGYRFVNDYGLRLLRFKIR